MSPLLSVGVLPRICHVGEKVESPILQVLGFRPIKGVGLERWVILSESDCGWQGREVKDDVNFYFPAGIESSSMTARPWPASVFCRRDSTTSSIASPTSPSSRSRTTSWPTLAPGRSWWSWSWSSSPQGSWWGWSLETQYEWDLMERLSSQPACLEGSQRRDLNQMMTCRRLWTSYQTFRFK